MMQAAGASHRSILPALSEHPPKASSAVQSDANLSGVRIVLLTNGPGELWGWVRPLSAELLRRGMEVEIRILPCQFASGEERRVALALEETLSPSAAGSDFESPSMCVSGPESSGRTALSLLDLLPGWLQRGKRRKKADAVVQLGGDLLWGRILSARNRVPLFCYTYGRKSGMERCDALFTAFPAMAEAIRSHLSSHKFSGKESGETNESIKADIRVVGDLVLDSLNMPLTRPVAETDGNETPAGCGPRVAFFPGSRGDILRFALPLIRRTVNVLRERFPGLVSLVVLSPFASSADLDDVRRACVHEGGPERMLPILGGGGEALKGVDFAVTQPGTNTLELMHCGVPFLVAVPFSSLRHVPLPGIAGLLARTPLIGPFLRESFLKSKGRRTGFLAWPNRLAGRPVVEELIGEITAGDIAGRVAEHLLDKERLARIRSDLAHLSLAASSGGRDASILIADYIERTLAGQ